MNPAASSAPHSDTTHGGATPPASALTPTFFPVTMGAMLVLERVDSPLLQAGDVAVSVSALIQAMYVLTRPAIQSLQLLQKGRDEFDTAVYAFADSIPLAELAGLANQMRAHFASAMPRKVNGSAVPSLPTDPA